MTLYRVTGRMGDRETISRRLTVPQMLARKAWLEALGYRVIVNFDGKE